LAPWEVRHHVDTLTFIAALVSAIAWPVAIIGVVALFRKQIGDVIAFVSLIKFKGLEVQIERDASALARSAQEALPAPKAQAGERKEAGPAWVPHQLAALADRSPREAIIEAWNAVSNVAVAALTKRGVRPVRVAGQVAPTAIEAELRRQGILNDGQLDVLKQLRNLRNAAVHAPAFVITPTAALEYGIAAYRLIAALELGLT